jgi:two-component system, NarL family, sensor kinase
MNARLVGVVTGLLILLTGGLVWERASTPADGTVVQLSNAPWRGDAMAVNLVPEGSSAIHRGDVVTHIDGRPLTAATEISPARDGETRVYTVERDGATLDVPVRIQAFPLGAAVGRNLATVLFLVTLLGTALYVFAHRPFDEAARALLLLAALTSCGATAWLLGGDALTLATSGPTVLQILGEAALTMVWGCLLHFALILPGSRLRPGRRLIVLLYCLPFAMHAGYLAVTLPTASGRAEAVGLATQISFLSSSVLPAVGVVLTLLTYRSMRDEPSRRRTRWVLIPYYIAVCGFVGLWTVPNALGLPVPPENWLPILFLPWALALSAVVLRYRWFDIELIIRRSLLYSALTVCVLAIFVGTTWLLSLVAGSGPGTLLASGVVALSAQPLRRWLRRRVGRLVYGERDDPYEVLARLGGIDAAAHPQRVLQDIAETLAQTLRLRYAAIDLGTVQAHCGHPLGDAVTRELVHGPEVLGQLVLEVGSNREPFGRADEHLLDTLMRQVGGTASAVLIGARLQASREQLVLAREEERRRLHHRLHDGLGAALAANAYQMEAARVQLRRDPGAADATLRTLVARMAKLSEDVHRLVNDQRPSILDQSGLAAAIRDRTGHLTEVTVKQTGDLALLPAAVEVAAFWIAVEAVHNAARHGGAAACRVHLIRGADLVIEVADDGAGLPVPFRPGGGFLSMRERAEELGGRWSVGAAPGGGTQVLVTLPLDPIPESQTDMGPVAGTVVPSGSSGRASS